MAAKGSSMKFEVEKFNGKGNFSLWQRRVKALLAKEGLHRALLGKSKKPDGMSDGDWEDIDLRAAGTIELCLADEVMFNVMEETSAEALWQKLENLYMTKSLSNKLYMKKQLYGLRMKEGENLLEHMNVFNGILNQLHSVDVKVEEEDKALLLLTSLPSSYDHMVTTLLYGKDTVKLEDVTAALLSNEMRKKPGPEGEQGQLLLSREAGGRGRYIERGSEMARSRSGSRKEGKIQCYHCKEFGHIRRDCPRRATKKDGDGSLNAAMVTDCDDSVCGNVLTVSTGICTSADEWILDSGSSYHVCSRRDWFDSFKEKEGTVRLGDDSVCEIAGEGTVKIRMFDGAVRTLGGVRYVPKMRRNLISLGVLDSRGCGYSARGGVLKVTRGVMVLMKGQKCGDIYRLIGNTMVGGVPMISTAGKRDVRKGPTAGEQPSRVSFAVAAGGTEIPKCFGVRGAVGMKSGFEVGSSSQLAGCRAS